MRLKCWEPFLLMAVAVAPSFSHAMRPGAPLGEHKEIQLHTGVELQVRRLAPGTVLKVVLRDKKKLEGRLVKVSGDGFRLLDVEGAAIVERSLPFDQVKKVTVSDPKPHRDPAAGRLIAGTAVGTGVLTVIILVIAGVI